MTIDEVIAYEQKLKTKSTDNSKYYQTHDENPSMVSNSLTYLTYPVLASLVANCFLSVLFSQKPLTFWSP